MAENETPQGATGATTEESHGSDDFDWKAAARKWESRAKESFAKAQANEDAAKRLAEIEDAKKSDEQKWQERLEKLENELNGTRRDAERARIQARYGISDADAELFLTAADSEQLEKQAKALADREAAKKKNGPTVPADRGNPGSGGSDPLRDLARQVFDND